MISFSSYLALSATDELKKARIVASAAHTLMSPFLKRLQKLDIHTSTIGQLKEYLKIIVIGLLHNTTVKAGEILPFVYISWYPFFLEGNQLRAIK